jgi:diguanylate cyclase (GGDEF)-like protein
MEARLQILGRREWWLWFSALVVTILSWAVLALTLFPGLFQNASHFYEIDSNEARWATLALVLVFNSWLVYRHRFFQLVRKDLTTSPSDRRASTHDMAADPSALDPVTNVYTRASSEVLLGKEVARARRINSGLSLVAFHIDDFAKLNEQHGSATGDTIAKEFVSRMRKASRGSDFIVRLESDDFLLVLPDCSLTDAKAVTDRMEPVEMTCSGKAVAITWSVGWIDYKRGDVPLDLYRRAGEVLRLYKQASKAQGGQATLLLR